MAAPENTARIRFAKPPIVEALIAVNIIRLPSFLLSSLNDVAPQMSAIGYERQDVPVTLHEMQMNISEGHSEAKATDTVIGFRFNSADSLYAAQFTLTGLVFSRLGDYDTWESFFAEAQRVWHIYLKAVEAVELISFGVRYLNKVFFPETADLNIYLRIYPVIPADLPQLVQESFMRLAMPIAQPPGKLVHQQILLPPEKPGMATVILDNDFQFPAIGVPLSQLWDVINGVRDIKDEYFLKFVTPELTRTFDA